MISARHCFRRLIIIHTGLGACNPLENRKQHEDLYCARHLLAGLTCLCFHFRLTFTGTHGPRCPPEVKKTLLNKSQEARDRSLAVSTLHHRAPTASNSNTYHILPTHGVASTCHSTCLRPPRPGHHTRPNLKDRAGTRPPNPTASCRYFPWPGHNVNASTIPPPPNDASTLLTSIMINKNFTRSF